MGAEAAIPAPRQRGFSFVEVLIAMSVLVVGSVSVLGLFAIGVNRMVQRRVDARLESVRPEIDSILQGRVDAARPGDLPQVIPEGRSADGTGPVALSRRGYYLSVTWSHSPFEGPGIWAHVSLIYQDKVVRRFIAALQRSYLDPKQLQQQKPAGK